MDQLRLHATICRVRFVFWRIKMSAGAMIHCRFVKNKFQMWPAYASLLDDIRQKTNRTRLITACKRIIPCHSISFPVTLYHSSSFAIIPCHSISFPVIPFHSLSFSIIPCHSLSFSVIPCHSLSFSIIPCHSLSFPIIPYPCISFPVIPCHS